MPAPTWPVGPWWAHSGPSSACSSAVADGRSGSSGSVWAWQPSVTAPHASPVRSASMAPPSSPGCGWDNDGRSPSHGTTMVSRGRPSTPGGHSHTLATPMHVHMPHPGQVSPQLLGAPARRDTVLRLRITQRSGTSTPATRPEPPYMLPRSTQVMKSLFFAARHTSVGGATGPGCNAADRRPHDSSAHLDAQHSRRRDKDLGWWQYRGPGGGRWPHHRHRAARTLRPQVSPGAGP